MILPYGLATQPQQIPGVSRKTGIWISPLVQGAPVIIDTAALREGEARYAGPDTFPEDCVLVVISPALNARWLERVVRHPYPSSGPLEAADLINTFCLMVDPTLAERLHWKML